MAVEWATMTLREAGVSLLDCEHRTPPAQEDGYPYIGIPQVKDGRIQVDGARRITREHFDEWRRKAKPQAFDVVLSRRCNPGETAVVTNGPEFALGQNLVLLRSDGTRVFRPFLRWLVRSPAWWDQVSKYINVGAVFDSLKCADIPVFQLPIPALSEQRAIAHILGTLDDKIELNRRMNETLEAMARALFKSWFVDFDPVRAKMEGREPYFDPNIWSLFPNSLDDQRRPFGWKRESIYKFADVIYGAPFSSKKFNSDGFGLPLIRIRDLRTHAPSVSTEEIHKKGHLVQPGDIVVGMDGEFRLYVWKGPNAWLNQRVCHFEPRPGVPTAFLAEALKEPLALFERGKVGTTVIHLGKSDIDNFEIIQPGSAILDAFDHIATPLLDLTVASALESGTLTETRDLLLPRLISGDIRVRDAEKVVEAVA